MVNGQSSITFNNLSEIVAVDDDQLAINLRVTFNDIVTDNEQFIFVITDATADAAGSQFAASDGGGINSVSDGDINKVQRTVTGCVFHRNHKTVYYAVITSTVVT